jgi:type II secretory ATPase GspE/PulE/Tfp pilus assembly ATPase PilB-like protein
MSHVAGAPPAFDVSKLSAENAVAKLIDHAVTIGASDLFLVCDQDALQVLVRHLGIMRKISAIPLEVGRRCIAHIKARAGMDTAEKRRPLDGRWIYTDEQDDSVDLRISIVPTVQGEDVAIRLLPRDTKLHDLLNLGLMAEQLEQVRTMVDSLGGLVLITGPTGAGKTATSYACLQRLNDGQRKINTIDDPVEYIIPGLRQSQVNTAIDVGFKDLLRGVLRQSPDVILIGEVRDTETAQTAVHAGNSGILVFATVHANHAAAAVQTMRSLGVQSHFLSTALRGVIAQRLIRTLCPKCKMSFDLSDAPGTFDEVRAHLQPGEGERLFASRGCDACLQGGYAGRTGVFEVLRITKQIRQMIAEGKTAAEVRQKAMEDKMLSFRQAALLKVAHGETSSEEVFRVIPPEQLLLSE